MDAVIDIIVGLAFAALVFSVLALFSNLSMFHTMAITHAIQKTDAKITINVGWNLAIAAFSTLIIALYFLS